MVKLLSRVSACSLVAASLLATAGMAAEDALYDAALPDDAVFIRWLDTPDAVDTVFGYSFSRAETDGDHYVAISNAHLTGAEPGRFYSVVQKGSEGPAVIDEPIRSDRSKVHLFLISCLDDPVALKVPGRAMTVIGPVTQMSAQSRAVNPVKTPLAVVNDTTGEVLHSFDVSLRRGQNLSFVACNGSVQLIENTVQPHASVGG